MNGNNNSHINLLLLSTALRTLTDSFVTGLLFVVAIKFLGNSMAAFASSIMLLIIFLFSPFIGFFIDKKIFSPALAGGSYALTGIFMLLFLNDFNIVYFYLNLFVLVVFNIPSSIYLSTWSSMVIKGKPAYGYSFLASINTLFYIIGTLFGSYLVQNDILDYWIIIKVVSSILVAIFLVFVFKKVDTILFDSVKPVKVTAVKDQSTNGSINFSLSSKGFFNPSWFNFKIIKKAITIKITKLNRFLLLFTFIIFTFTLLRTFVLLNVAFKIYDIFEGNIFYYTVIINTAALTAFVFFPFNGKLAEKFGSINYYALGLIITPFYLISFLIFTNPVILIILWALPLGVITEVAQMGVISVMTNKDERNSAIGIITSASAFGSVLGSFLLSTFVNQATIMNVLVLLMIFLPFVLILLILPVKKFLKLPLVNAFE